MTVRMASETLRCQRGKSTRLRQKKYSSTGTTARPIEPHGMRQFER